jgi:vancomycin resistance protein YoaR
MTNDTTRAENAAEGGTAPTAVLDPGPGAVAQPKWLREEPPARKKHLGLWLGAGIPGVLVIAAAVVAALALIAPGVSVAGASVGLLTRDAAQHSISSRLAHAQIRLGDATLTGAQLGASVDAQALAAKAKGDHPLWNVTAWNPKPIAGAVTIDPEVALPALRTAAPQLFTNATDAQVVFDDKAGKFTAVAAKPGKGVDVKALAASLSEVLTGSEGPVTVTPQQTTVDAAATTAKAQAFADKLNQQADTAGFYLQDQKAEALPLATVASWLSVKADSTTGNFTITPNQAAIDAAVAGLPAQVNQQPKNASVVINSSGKTLKTLQAGHDGYGITSTDGVAAQLASSVSTGDFTFALQGQVEKYTTTTVFRRIEVDKSAGTTTLFEGPKPGQEKATATYPIAIGTGGAHETRDGHYTIYTQLPMQNMGNCDGKHPQFDYCTKNVPWISYFDGDQGFHGTYWHNNFGPGARMSHGCVNMRIPDALALYKFAQVGTEVWVHD